MTSTFREFYNPTHGMELVPGKTEGKRDNENGILYLVELIFLKHMRGEDTSEEVQAFRDLSFRLITKEHGRKVYGLYDRGEDESVTIPTSERRSISKDNMGAFSSGAFFCIKRVAEQIYEYGLKHFGVYNNRKPKIRLPFNPGNFCVWSYNGGSDITWLLFIPFYILDTIVAVTREKKNTSGKWRTFTELYPLRNENFFWRSLWEYYVDSMRDMYGCDFLDKLATEYFWQTSENPIRKAAKGIVFDKTGYRWSIETVL